MSDGTATSRQTVLRARYVVPAEGQAIENGAVQIRDGRIAALGRAREFPYADASDLGDVVLLPGFVNAHTHLELTHLAGRVPTDRGFVPWIERLVAALVVGGDAGPLVRASVRSGIQQSLRAGVTTVGDITRLPELTRPLLREARIRAVSFGEVIAIGRLRDELTACLAAAASEVCASDLLRIGISPHAPYTVEPAGLRACVARASAAALPLCTHLAETADEEAFTRRLSGPLRGYLERMGAWDDNVPCSGMGPVELVDSCGVLGSVTVLAHVNYVSDADIERIARSGAHVAWCPRTHDAFGHPPHRFQDMLAAGINVCVGTDSLASNPSLSILDELRFVHAACPDVPLPVVLAMGTRNGAKALGLDGCTGSLAPGYEADLAVVPYEPNGPAEPLRNVLEGTQAAVGAYVQGEAVEG